MAKYRLDEMDLKILDILIEDARKPYIDVAKALDISSGTVNVRIRKMEELGIIKSSAISLDYERMGYTLLLMWVSFWSAIIKLSMFWNN
ncbi:Regulatory protein AsnC [Capnocytophaga ochracea]|uniref:Regulatory protein AsnC n=1 Tax=Capnocytophaga ochracea TaxID=1018 RepID=A0A2X2SZ87_CAPOC|nr:Regulatory protein AsnC [Capnocytophaga ochracea]